jgi:hypothetical protein
MGAHTCRKWYSFSSTSPPQVWRVSAACPPAGSTLQQSIKIKVLLRPSPGTKAGSRPADARPRKADNVTVLRGVSKWAAGVAGAVTAAAASAAVIAALSSQTGSSAKSSTLSSWLGIAGALIGVAATLWGFVQIILNRRRRKTQRIDDEIRIRAKGTDSEVISAK